MTAGMLTKDGEDQCAVPACPHAAIYGDYCNRHKGFQLMSRSALTTAGQQPEVW